MNSRRCKRSESAENLLLSFVEVKEEPDEQLLGYNELLPQAEDIGRKSSTVAVNKCASESRPKPAENKESKTHYRRSRATQVNSEDIDIVNVRRSDILNNHAENKPIKAIGTESIIPQCRFCLRRVSRENLKIILRKQSAKALAAFQIRVFHHDAYPFACSNCLNMIDIILDYRSAVTKARNLLLDKRMHLENEGWDDPVNIECFNQCKSAVERHRMQIDAIYDEMAREERRTAQIMEPKTELTVDNNQTINPSDMNDIQNASTQNTVNDELTVELALESGIEEVENVLKAHVADRSLESGNLINADEVFDLPAENPESPAPETNPAANENEVLPHKRRKVKEIKVHYSSESDHNDADDDYNPADSNTSENDEDDQDYIPAPSILKQKTTVKSDSEQEIPEKCEPKKRKYRKRHKEPHQPKVRAKETKPRKPRRPRESMLNRPPDYKPPSIQPVLCDLCGESVRPETIEGHRNRHLGIKPYNCPVDECDWTFHGRANLSNHLRRMHPENGVQSLKCDVCGKFIRGKPGILNEHKKLHFLKEKSYVCPVCGKGFTLNRYLRQHSVIHTGLFPYECSYCGKKFNNKWSMKTHEKNMHEKKSQVSTSYDPAMDVEQTGQAYIE